MAIRTCKGCGGPLCVTCGGCINEGECGCKTGAQATLLKQHEEDTRRLGSLLIELTRLQKIEQAAREVVRRRDVGPLLKHIDALAAALDTPAPTAGE
jgi:hypothetical protein